MSSNSGSLPEFTEGELAEVKRGMVNRLYKLYHFDTDSLGEAELHELRTAIENVENILEKLDTNN